MTKIAVFFLMFCFIISAAQKAPDLSKYKTDKEKIVAWEAYCKTMSEEENYEQLISQAEKGIIIAKNNPQFLSKFYFYKAYAYEYTNNQYDKATYYFEKSLELARQTKSQRQQVLAMMRLNYMYYSTKNFVKGKQLFNEIKKTSDTIKDKELKGILLGSLGEYYLDRSEFENFINYKLQAIDFLLIDPKKDELKTNNIGVSYLQIADAYNDMKNYPKALEYCKYAEPFLNKPDGIAFLHNSYIETYTHLGDIINAQKHYKKIYELAELNDFLDLNISYANRNMAELYLNKNRLQLAEDYADKALYFAKKSTDEEIEMEADVIKGKVLFEKKDYQNAIDILNKALKFSFVYDKRAFAEINEKLSQSHAALHQWEKAYQYHNIYTKTNDSLLIESGKQSLANAEAKFQNKSKQKTINTLSAENIINDLQIKNIEKQKILLISGISLIGIIGGLLYYQSRNRKKLNQKLSVLNQELDKANKTKIQFFGILNHDLRSPISRLIHFLNLQKEAPEMMDETTKLRLENQTYHSAELLLRQMEDLLLWSKGQMEHFQPEKVEVPVDSIFEDVKEHFSDLENIEFLYNAPQNLLVFTDPEYLKTIIRNLTNNAVKVLKDKNNAKIIWSAKDGDNDISMTISDNGEGANLEKFRAFYDDTVSIGIKNGLGMHLIRDLSKAIDAEIFVESKLGIGTSITLKIKKA